METPNKTSVAPMPLPRDLDAVSRLRERLLAIENHTKQDVLAMYGVMDDSVAIRTRLALEHINGDCRSLLVILDTLGGSVESVKTIVHTLRNFYDTVDFLVPVQAMSAGTVLVMSGDSIQMDYFSRLGPIDPQVVRNGKYVPALSYLRQYNKMQEKAKVNELTNVDVFMMKTLDLAELDQIQLAADLSISLITEWLSNYKFKDWNKPPDEKKKRATEIAEKLNSQEKWFVHGHGIHKDVLENDLRLKIKDYAQDSELKSLVWQYFWPMAEFVQSQDFPSFVQSRKFT